MQSDEPYRYACPHGHRAVVRVGNKPRSDCPRRFRCESCRDNDAIAGCHYVSVTDLKTGREVRP